MRTNTITFAGASALLVVLAIGLAIVRPVLAQVAATSTDSTAASTSPVDTIAASTPTEASSTQPAENTATSTLVVKTTLADSSAAATNSAGSTATAGQKATTEPQPAGLTEVHIIGTKYIDYFTDGSTTIAIPGDPNIDANFDKPNAPIPTHAGMTWVHTTGQNRYDTPSGDLDVGDYAVQADGSYIQHPPPFVSSTSTAAQLPTRTTDNAAAGTSASANSVAFPPVPNTSTSTPNAPSDNSSLAAPP